MSNPFMELLKNFVPLNEQEKLDQQAFLHFLERNPDAFERSNLTAHVTTSTIIVNQTMDRVVFGFHQLYQSWGWIGGHNDGDSDVHHVALKETQEETGLTRLAFHSKNIFMLDTIHVTNHLKHGRYVPDHLHFNVTFLLIADEQESLVHDEREHKAVKWFSIQDVLNHVSEPRMIPVYQKAFQKIQMIKEKKS